MSEPTTKPTAATTKPKSEWQQNNVRMGGFWKKEKQATGEKYLAGRIWLKEADGTTGEQAISFPVSVYINKSETKTEKSFDSLIYGDKKELEEALAALSKSVKQLKTAPKSKEVAVEAPPVEEESLL